MEGLLTLHCSEHHRVEWGCGGSEQIRTESQSVKSKFQTFFAFSTTIPEDASYAARTKIKLLENVRIRSDLCQTGLCCSSDDPQTTKQKGGTLLMQYPQKSEGKELKILIQPETQHRARYLTEGSRGSVKDRTQQGFPTVKVTVKPLMQPL